MRKAALSAVERAANIDDLKRLAKRHLPKLVYDYIEGGAEDEIAVSRNRQAFESFRLLPRYLVDIGLRDQSVALFGRRYASPFGIAPTGLNGFARPGADLMLAAAAQAADIPFVLSGAGTSSIESVARIAPRHSWFQLYVARESKITQDIVIRAVDAGIDTLMLTVDVPAYSRREREIRNGFMMPPRIGPAMIADMLCHPLWLVGLARYGIPGFGTWTRYAGGRRRHSTAFFAAQIPFTQTWRDLEAIRRLWPGKLVIKGILHPDDARMAVDLGADGIVVSNHGGRQLDRAPAALDMLPLIARAVGERTTVMLDGGIRRGMDMLIAYALGARFVFTGRSTLYGVAAGGGAGARKAIEILRTEIDTALAQLGRPRFEEITAEILLASSPEAPR